MAAGSISGETSPGEIAGPTCGRHNQRRGGAMPLRARLTALVCAIMLVCLAGGGILITWHAAGRVQTELRAALSVGANTVENGLKELKRADDHAAELRRLIATFNGNRHVR